MITRAVSRSKVKMDEVMLDLETLGSTPNSMIATIGAVKFDKVHGLGEEFYAVIDVVDAQKKGYNFDIQASTFLWWLQQSKEAQDALCSKDMIPIEEALRRFNSFCERDKSEEVGLTMWGNGADFDCVLLSNAYDKCGIKKPWSFRNNRCFRTVKGLLPTVKIAKNESAHNALGDAIHQANHLIQILQRSRI